MGNNKDVAITIENCEHYFLLYIDNELNIKEKNAVEQFILQNPTTKQIFEELQNVILTTENISFNKQNLYKPTGVNINNYETFIIEAINGKTTIADQEAIAVFAKANPSLQSKIAILQQTKLTVPNYNFNKTLLYKTTNSDLQNNTTIAEILLLQLDGQCIKNESNAIQQLINTNSTIAKEWQLLQNTKLPNEIILHPNKKSLYKKEKEQKPIVPMWLRYTAAACLLLGITYTTVQLNTNKTTTPNQVVVQNNTINNPSVIKNDTTNFITAPQNIVKQNIIETNIIETQKSEVVKNTLTTNNNVTNVQQQRTINNNGTNKKVLTLNDNNVDLANNTNTQLPIVINNIVTETNVINLPTTLSNTLQNDIAKIDKNVEVNYYTEQTESNISLLNIDVAKIDKKNNTGKFKDKLTAFVKEKRKSIGSSVTIAGYEIALAKSR